MSTITSPIIPNIKITDIGRSQMPQETLNAVIVDVAIAEELSEYGSVQVNLYFDLNNGKKPINKTLFIRPEQLVKGYYDTTVKPLLERFNSLPKGPENKELRKSQFSTEEWGTMWGYKGTIEDIVVPLFEAAKAQELDFNILRGLAFNVTVGRDHKDVYTVLKVNGKAK